MFVGKVKEVEEEGFIEGLGTEEGKGHDKTEFRCFEITKVPFDTVV